MSKISKVIFTPYTNQERLFIGYSFGDTEALLVNIIPRIRAIRQESPEKYLVFCGFHGDEAYLKDSDNKAIVDQAILFEYFKSMRRGHVFTKKPSYWSACIKLEDKYPSEKLLIHKMNQMTFHQMFTFAPKIYTRFKHKSIPINYLLSSTKPIVVVFPIQTYPTSWNNELWFSFINNLSKTFTVVIGGDIYDRAVDIIRGENIVDLAITPDRKQKEIDFLSVSRLCIIDNSPHIYIPLYCGTPTIIFGHSKNAKRIIKNNYMNTPYRYIGVEDFNVLNEQNRMNAITHFVMNMPNYYDGFDVGFANYFKEC